MTFAEYPARVVLFGFTEGRLSAVSVTLGQAAFPDAAAALRVKYGAPTRTKQSTVANLTGARLPQVVHTWVIPGRGAITAGLRTDAMDTADVLYQSEEHIAAESAKRRNTKPDI